MVQPPKGPPAADSSSSSSSSSATTATTTAAPMTVTPKPTSSAVSASSSSSIVRDEDLDDDEREALEAVRKTGYRVHWRKAEDEAAIRLAIGGAEAIAPKRIIDPAAAAASTTSGGGGSPMVVDSSTAPAAISSGSSSSSTASAWNTAGTVEQRHMGIWLRDRIATELLSRSTTTALAPLSLPLAGDLITATAPTDWDDSSADIIIARGKKKWVYDCAFNIPITFGGAATSASKVVLRFADVSNTTAGEIREIRFSFSGTLANDDKITQEIREALRLDGMGAGGRIINGIREAVEVAVEAFLAL